MKFLAKDAKDGGLFDWTGAIDELRRRHGRNEAKIKEDQLVLVEYFLELMCDLLLNAANCVSNSFGFERFLKEYGSRADDGAGEAVPEQGEDDGAAAAAAARTPPAACSRSPGHLDWHAPAPTASNNANSAGPVSPLHRCHQSTPLANSTARCTQSDVTGTAALNALL